MKKPPSKEETKVVDQEKNLSSKSEVIPTKSNNNTVLKTLDTIKEEDENNRESVVEPLSQNILS